MRRISQISSLRTSAAVKAKSCSIHQGRHHATSVPTITDPLVKYKSLLSTGVLAPDPAQHRLALHLRGVYSRLKDYVPATEYRDRLNQIAELSATSPPADGAADSPDQLAVRGHSIWGNPLFKKLMRSPHADDMALVRLLSSHEHAMEMDSPKGLFVSGEVGTGKSMLLNLLSDGLPTSRKRRWHFNTFMLYVFSQLEAFRRSKPHLSQGQAGGGRSPYPLLWMAHKLVEESPILFLDEFQMPDRAASKILNHLMIAFFQLGGVLVASSNRMPEELQRASGVDYAPAPFRDMVTKFLSFGMKQQKGELFGSMSDFSGFVDVLKARCDFWNMDGSHDYRRQDLAGAGTVNSADRPGGMIVGNAFCSVASTGGIGLVDGISPDGAADSQSLPSNYRLLDQEDYDVTLSLFPDKPVSWNGETLYVYGHAVKVPKACDGVAVFNFGDLADSMGPADYITLASTYHTFVVNNVPVLGLAQKNEARRFITFLDALYESGCRLHIRAEKGPDDLFFPESRSSDINSPPAVQTDEHGDATYPETMAEVYQDQAAPFRPNVSYYDTPSATSQYDPDQDAGRHSRSDTIDYTETGAFTGEDERFAYKRAASRLWELCSESWHTRKVPWWRPLPKEARHWEASLPSTTTKGHKMDSAGLSKQREIVVGERVAVAEHAGLGRFAGKRAQQQET
ncbi:hypothetical protein Cpir12675_005557 [Ceratocystis pirilliformis]|uniref:Lactation elevated protein 1 n=1 Tax=Ceratocystis pirilliformis TaxID=259994 RepID=A0ABR3YNU5_9PEZI